MLRPLSVLLALLVVIAVWRVAGAQPEPTRQDREVDQVVEELNDIRQSVGSPLGNRNEFQRGFQQAARNVVQRGAYDNFRAETDSDDYLQPLPRVNSRAYRVQPSLAVRPAGNAPHAQLQTKAFELDQLAHHLETGGNYEDADAIREAATSLRSLARKLAEKAKPEPTASFDAPVIDRVWGEVAPPSPALQPPQPVDPPAVADE